MKKIVKKMFKHTVLYSAMLIGFLISGGQSVFAAEDLPLKYSEFIYDYEGNKIVYDSVWKTGHEYYLEPANAEDTSQRVTFKNWENSQWAKLGSKSDAITFRLEDKTISPLQGSHDLYEGIVNEKESLFVSFKKEEYDGDIFEDYIFSTFLTPKSNGVELVRGDDFSINTSSWEVYKKLQGDKYTFAFKNTNTGMFLSHRNSGEWLYVDQSKINKNTLWKLVKK
ncbi:hypothetical protein FC697_22640 [Bacillus wiedmannii]|uniref:hypothetical protein n=1 Tax=Bacillus wiedmannii TaxID=1890302 RepID=UPI0010BD928C|nr:hypothetical protein [Bacillus wiedmannii]TKH16971.1 hypothetical protein FC697_22640 [Bacillus wiedmannii]